MKHLRKQKKNERKKKMKLKNKKTGEIPDKIETIAYIQWSKMIMLVYINNDGERIVKQYNSLNAFNEEWEDYEEPKGYWYIDFDGDICGEVEPFDEETNQKRKAIGNKFETQEEAKKAVEKLEALTRLEEKGFRFKDWFYDVTYVLKDSQQDKEGWSNEITINARCSGKADKKDLDILFGGEE